jgi:hypothetical protein
MRETLPKYWVISVVVFITILTRVFLPDAHAQFNRYKNRYGIGRSQLKTKSFTLGTGTSTYFGDLCPTGDCFSTTRPQLNIGFRRGLNQQFSYRADILYYSISGADAKTDDPSLRRRNLSFTSRNMEASVTGQIDFVSGARYSDRFSRRQFITPFLFAGLGITTLSPKTKFNGSTVALRPLRTEGVSYSSIQPIIPIGAGVRIKIGVSSDALIEVGYRITFTDYMDDVSGRYKARESFNDPVALALSDRRSDINPSFANDAFALTQWRGRGNPDKKDSYLCISAKISYTFTDSEFTRFKRMLLKKGKRKLPRYK